MIGKVKKIVISMIIGIIAVLAIQNTAQAYYVGQQIKVYYNDINYNREWHEFEYDHNYASNNNIYCIEKGRKANWDSPSSGYHEIVSYVRIEGYKSWGINTGPFESYANAKFAAILSGDNGNNFKNVGPVANGVWAYMRIWLKEVGWKHLGMNGYPAINPSYLPGSWNDLDVSSTQYADSLKNNVQITDKTNKDNVKVVSYEKDGRQYMRVGPFNWQFSGNLSEITLHDENNKVVSELTYSKFNGNDEVSININEIKSENDFYISIPVDSGINKVTKISAKLTTNVKGVHIWFLKKEQEIKNWGDYQDLILIEPYNTKQELNMDFEYNIVLQGNLKVIKVNKDNEIVKLEGVGFYIQNKNTGKYVKQNNNGTVSYVQKEQATEFITDQNGEILIKNLLVGTYVAYETKNPNYGYEIISEGVEKTIVVDKTAELKIPNMQRYVKLSGYVWVDEISQKMSVKNALYKDNDYDTGDVLLDGVTVRLKDKIGNTIKETKTTNGGTYLFIDVLIEELENYYIEFEYDGLTYTNVIPHIDKDNGSKSAESEAVRRQFNQNFAIVEGKAESTGITRDLDGNKKYDLSYNLDKLNHVSTLINNGRYSIIANTNETGYSIEEHFVPGQEEIKYINLGLYRREQPDMAVVNDIQNIKLTINGYEHIYEYDQRHKNQAEYGDGFNIGVKFEEKYANMVYTRPIYKADYEFENPNDKSKELKVYVTHKFTMKNETTSLITKINSLVDYFDSKYSIVKVYKLDEAGNEVELAYNKDSEYNSNSGYSKVIINTNTKIKNQEEQAVYIEFALNREAVLNLLNTKQNLKNVVEINSYSIFDKNGSVYAGIDKDSNPENATPGDITTYQDDTASSPDFKLEVTDAREMTGKVFLDSTSGELKVGETRQGSGAYEEGEMGISGVQVTLTENTGSGKVYTVTTDENGDFAISGFIPGDYTLTYTWGDDTYTVQNYKGTVYDSTRKQDNKYWYKENVDIRLTDALDNYDREQDAPNGSRKQIDNEIINISKDKKYTITKMDSTTPTMGIGVEYETTYTASTGDKYIYRISNVDFGIVERARQSIDLVKSVGTVKLTLANGQVIVDAKINEDGTIEGERRYLAYMAPSQNTNPKEGLIKIELDNELIQDALLEVQYNFKAVNESEIEYMTKDYYLYGKVGGEVATITPIAIVDYLDGDWDFVAENNSGWKVISQNELKELVVEEVFTNGSSTINDKKILYSENLKKKLVPNENISTTLKVSKRLANGPDIYLENEVEIVKLEKDPSPELDSIVGNYIPGEGKTEKDDHTAPTVVVTPNTGANLNFILPIAIGMIALSTLVVGVIFIKKKVLDE